MNESLVRLVNRFQASGSLLVLATLLLAAALNTPNVPLAELEEAAYERVRCAKAYARDEERELPLRLPNSWDLYPSVSDTATLIKNTRYLLLEPVGLADGLRPSVAQRTIDDQINRLVRLLERGQWIDLDWAIDKVLPEVRPQDCTYGAPPPTNTEVSDLLELRASVDAVLRDPHFQNESSPADLGNEPSEQVRSDSEPSETSKKHGQKFGRYNFSKDADAFRRELGGLVFERLRDRYREIRMERMLSELEAAKPPLEDMAIYIQQLSHRYGVTVEQAATQLTEDVRLLGGIHLPVSKTLIPLIASTLLLLLYLVSMLETMRTVSLSDQEKIPSDFLALHRHSWISLPLLTAIVSLPASALALFGGEALPTWMQTSLVGVAAVLALAVTRSAILVRSRINPTTKARGASGP